MRRQNYTLRTRDYRYILYNNGSEELYDHHNDPKEWNNLSSKKKLQENKRLNFESNYSVKLKLKKITLKLSLYYNLTLIKLITKHSMIIYILNKTG